MYPKVGLRINYFLMLCFSNCEGVYLLGGKKLNDYEKKLSRSYNTSIPHNYVYVTLEVWLFGDWEDDDSITVKTKDLEMEDIEDITTTVSCTPTYNGNVMKFKAIFQFADSENVFQFRFFAEPEGNGKSAGIRNIKILLSQKNLQIQNCLFPTTSTFDDSCRCPFRKYAVGNSCQDCDGSCESCFGGDRNCTSCAPNHHYSGSSCNQCSPGCNNCFGSGSNECLSCEPNLFLHPTKTCLSYCDPPMVERTEGPYKYCDIPPQCSSSYFFANQTCAGPCDFPFFPDTSSNTCEFACTQPPMDFMYPNGTCKGSCTDSFETVTQGVEKYCKCLYPNYLYENGACLSTCPYESQTIDNIRHCIFPCTEPGYPYLSWDGTCLASCPNPNIITTGPSNEEHCDTPCKSPNFLFENNDCDETCPAGGQVEHFGDVQYCGRKCEISSHFYDLESENCVEDCPPPKVHTEIHSYKICSLSPPPEDSDSESDLDPGPEPIPNPPLEDFPELVLSQEEVEEVKGLANVGNTAGTASNVGLSVANAISPGDPGGVSAGLLSKMLQYAKFMNISYTPRLELMFKLQNSSSAMIPFTPKMSPKLKAEFDNQPIPKKFERYQIHSSFIVNFWDSGLALCITCGIVLILRLLEWLSLSIQKKYLPHSIIQLIRTTAQNFMFIQLYGSFGDVVLFSALEFRASKLDSVSSCLSTITATLSIGICILTLVMHIKVLNRYQNLRKKTIKKRASDKLETFQKDHAGVQICFGAFKDSSFSCQGYLFFFVLRAICTNLTLAFLFTYPFAQSLLMMLMTLTMVGYLVIKRPFKLLINLIQQITFELILLVVNIVLVILASMDMTNSTSINTRENLSQVILTCNLLFSFLPSAFLVAKVGVLVYDFYKQWKPKKLNKGIKVRAVQNNRVESPNPVLNLIRPDQNINVDSFVKGRELQIDRKDISKERGIYQNKQTKSLDKNNERTLKEHRRSVKPHPIRGFPSNNILQVQKNTTSKSNLFSTQLLDTSNGQ